MFLILLLKGFIIGVAFIIPGVSGGTLAIYLGVYQGILDSIDNLFRQFKKSVLYLLPILLGAGLSVVLLAKLVSILLDWNSFIVLFFFIGLIIGGIRFVYKRAEITKLDPSLIISFLVSFGLLILIIILDKTSSNPEIDYFSFSFWTYLLIFALGAIASITMIVPGISGSAVLLVLGFYTAIVSNVVGNIFDFSSIGYNLQVVIPFGLGALAGILVFSKIINFSLRKYPKQTYFAILGFIIASVMGVLLEIKDQTTASLFSDQISIFNNLLNYLGDNIFTVAGGLIALAIGYLASKFLTQIEGGTVK
jgi:putative membrane protein